MRMRPAYILYDVKQAFGHVTWCDGPFRFVCCVYMTNYTLPRVTALTAYIIVSSPSVAMTPTLTQQYDDDVLLCVLANFHQPRSNVVEADFVRHIVQQQQSCF